MQLNPYLSFNGDCAEACKFYEQVLGAKLAMSMTYAGSPAAAHAPPDWQDKILHAHLLIGGQSVMACDIGGGRYEEPKGTWISIGVTDPGEAERIYNGLAEGGKVVMALDDKFRIPWMVNCEKPAHG
jgi:PhnB protein